MRSQPVVISGSGTAEPVIRPWPMGFEQSEAWLQGLIHRAPQLLPVDDLEPGLGTLVPAAMEVACSHGFIDNLFITADGDLVLVEVKLWKNPESRRAVVAQVLDYIASLSTMGFHEFEAAVLKARGDGAVNLHSLIPEHLGPLAEPQFIDAVSRNLKRGRILAILVGDGVRVETERLVDLLQSHSGAHFTLALVAISFFVNDETSDLIAVPDTLLRTVMVERGIVVVENGTATIKPVLPKPEPTTKTITSELFDEALAGVDPMLPARLHGFVDELARYDVYAEQKKSLMLMAHVPGLETPIKLGYVDRAGRLWTDNVLPAAPPEPARQYLHTLAYLIGGGLTDNPTWPKVITSAKSIPLVATFLDRHREAWLTAVTTFIAEAEAVSAKVERS